jgi:TonB family protein
MATPRLFIRDHRNLALKLIAALALSLAVHGALIFGARTSLVVRAVEESPRILRARLVVSESPAFVSRPEADAVPVSTARPLMVADGSAEASNTPRRRVPAHAASAPRQTASLPVAIDPVFYTWREVDVTAKLIGVGAPVNAAPGERGHVLVEVWVDETGRVDHAAIVEADPAGQFDIATLAYYERARFSPAMKDGVPRRFRTRFVVEFGNRPAEQHSR